MILPVRIIAPNTQATERFDTPSLAGYEETVRLVTNSSCPEDKVDYQ